MYSRVHFLICACLIASATAVVAGAIGVLPPLIERLSLPASADAPSCTDAIRLPWGRTCSTQPVSSSIVARRPGTDVQVLPDPDHVTGIEPPQPRENTASAVADFLEPRATGLPPAQLASAPIAVEEVAQTAPTPQTTTASQAAPTEPSVKTKPPTEASVKAKPRPVRKVARREPSSERREASSERREPSSERRREEALSTVRRFGRSRVRENPVDAYAYEAVPRRMIIIRPTTIQDVYYYYR